MPVGLAKPSFLKTTRKSPTGYRSDVSARTASDVKSKAALRQTIAVSFASAGRARAGIFGDNRLASVGLLAAIIGNSGFITRHYNAISRGCIESSKISQTKFVRFFHLAVGSNFAL